MPVTAKVRFLRVSPWKVRRYARAFVGNDIDKARAFLSFEPSPTCKSLLKLLNSAVANAENNYELDPKLLVVKRVVVDGGPSYKRWQPSMRGRALPIKKRTCHVTIELDFKEELRVGRMEQAPLEEKKARKAKAEAEKPAAKGKKVSEKTEKQAPKKAMKTRESRGKKEGADEVKAKPPKAKAKKSEGSKSSNLTKGRKKEEG